MKVERIEPEGPVVRIELTNREARELRDVLTGVEIQHSAFLSSLAGLRHTLVYLHLGPRVVYVRPHPGCHVEPV